MKDMKKDLHTIRPYGDHWDDGKIQLSFTLPMASSPEAKEAAKIYLEKMGFVHVEVVSMEPMGERYSFFVVYAHAVHRIDVTKIHVPKLEFPILSFEALIHLAREKLKRRIVVVGGTTGTDAHTVGIDAILSTKGVAGDRGLEHYPIFRVVNLRAQVSEEDLVRKAVEFGADAILVSQLVTQQDQHLKTLKSLARRLRQEKKLSSHLLKIVGGPRMDQKAAHSVGFDAGFGPGTKPSEVANYIVHELIRRQKVESHSAFKKRSLFGWLGGRD